MSRWIRLQTSIFEHALFSGKEFSERDAWVWLIGKAAWKDTRHRVGTQLVAVPTGSVFLTLREMQAVWRWKSDYRVRSFLKTLENERMIIINSNAGKTQISICNYAKYQNSVENPNAEETQKPRKENAEKTQGKRTKDTISTSNTISPSFSLRSKDERSLAFERFWQAYPNKIAMRKAKPALENALERASLDVIIAGAEKYAAKTDQRQWCSPVTWLEGDRWEDAPAAVLPAPKAASPLSLVVSKAIHNAPTVEHKPSPPVDYEKLREEYRAQEIARCDRTWGGQ